MKKYFVAILALICCMATSMAAEPEYISDSTYKELRHLADDENDGDAQFTLGNYFYQQMVKGYSAEQSRQGAVRYWALARLNHHPQGTGNLAFCYRNGFGVDQDTVKASKLYVEAIGLGNDELVETFDAAARDGSAFEALVLYQCASEGKGMAKNERLATQYLTLAADAGDPTANLAVANLLYKNRDYVGALDRYRRVPNPSENVRFRIAELSIDSNPAQSMDSLLAMAARDNVNAMEMLGKVYYNGIQTPVDMAAAASWNRRAAARGSHRAAWLLASQLINGRGVERDYDQAIYFLENAAPAGYATALRDSITEAWEGTPFQDYLFSVAFMKAADYARAKTYLDAKGLKKLPGNDIRQAKLMAARGDASNAFKSLKKRADKKEIAAYYPLAELLIEGRGTDKDEKLGLQYALKGCEAGDPFAMCYAGLVYAKMGKYNDAFHYLSMADDLGVLTPEARDVYVKCYERGLGVEKDTSVAETIRKAVPTVRLVNVYTVARDIADKKLASSKKK